jgi:hypothetical protein
LKAGLWVRRARLAIVAPDPRHSRRSQADFPLIGLSEFARPPLFNGLGFAKLPCETPSFVRTFAKRN